MGFFTPFPGSFFACIIQVECWQQQRQNSEKRTNNAWLVGSALASTIGLSAAQFTMCQWQDKKCLDQLEICRASCITTIITITMIMISIYVMATRAIITVTQMSLK